MKFNFTESQNKLLADLEVLQVQGVYPSITRDIAEYIFDLLKKKRPQHLLEVGSCVGYSTIWLGLAAKDFGSSIEAIEWTPERFEKLKENIEIAELNNIITAYNGDAKVIIPELKSNYDFVFIDAMKKEYLNYLQLLEPKLLPGALIIADNILSHREKLLDFVQYVKNNPNYTSEIVPLGAGLLVAKYK